MDKQITLHTESPFFQVVLNILRAHFNTYSAERVEKTIKINNAGKDTGLYKFIVDWQSEEQSSFDIFKVLENA